MEEIKTTYKTTDIYLATALLMNGAELTGFEETKNVKKQMIFVLAVPNMDHEKKIKEYFDGVLLVEAKTFVETFKVLKQKMFAKLNSY